MPAAANTPRTSSKDSAADTANAQDTVKVVVAFHRDPRQIGKTVEASAEEARTLIAEGRARLAADTGHPGLRGPAGPTEPPPAPNVVPPRADPAP